MLAKRNVQILLSVLGIIFVAIGVYFRAQSLGKFPFAIDEYYFYSSVKLILENGLPKFDCGGYYSRGILLQYLTAPFIYFTENQELAARIPTVIFSALTFPAVYLIGRDCHSRIAGVIAVFLFAFSIWQIEFARFARMYAPFQMVFLWQVMLFIRPNFPSRNSNINLSSLLAIIATLFYAGGIFCVALAFFNIILHQKSFKILEYFPASIAACLAVLLNTIPFRHLGAIQPLPANEYLQKSETALTQLAANNLPIDLPGWLAISSHSFSILILFLLCTLFSIIFIINVFKNIHINILEKCLLSIIPLTLLLNQFLLTTGLFTIYLLITKNWRELYKILASKIGMLYLTSTTLWIIICFIYLVLSQEAYGALNLIKVIFNNFFSYPDVYFDVFKQWQKPMPIHTTISILAIALFSFLCIIDRSSKCIKKRHFFSVLILLCLLVAIINTPYNTSRYSYFLSPIIQIIIAICITTFSLYINNKFSKLLIIIVSTSAVFYLSEDYRLNHVLSIDSYKINHRQVYDNKYTEHLYPRYDYISIANYININAGESDLIITTTPVIEYYLENKTKAEYFITPDNSEFINHSVCNGKMETWSKLPLIYSHESLTEKLLMKDTIKWVILHGEKGNPFSTHRLETLKKDLHPYLTFENPDKTLRVYKLPGNATYIH
jgi:hypothetical protein